MDFQQLKVAVRIVDGTVTVATGALGASIDAMLARSYGNDPLVIKGAAPGPGDGENGTVVVVGRSDFLEVAGAPVEARLFVDGAGAAQAVVEHSVRGDGAGATGWRFSTSFPERPTVLDLPTGEGSTPADGAVAGWSSPLDQLDLLEARFVVASVAGHEPRSRVPLQAGTNFVGSMRPGGYLGIFESLVGAGLLTLYGTVEVPEPPSGAEPLDRYHFPWSRPAPVPGICLQADLELGEVGFGDRLRLGIERLRVYSPGTNGWLTANDTFVPVVAYTGKLSVPSAGITVEVTGVVDAEAGRVTLTGAFEGVTLQRLADLLDVAGTDGLLDALPTQLKNIGDQLGSLGLRSATIELSRTDGRFGVESTSLEIAMASPTWVLRDTAPRLAVDGLTLDVEVDKPFGARSLDATVRGTLEIESVALTVSATYKDGYAVYASLSEAATIPLSRLLATYAGGLPAPGDLTIDSLDVAVAPGHYYTMSATMADEPHPWKIPLGPVDLVVSDVSLYLLYAANGPVTGSFGGTVSLGDDLSLDLLYSIPGDVLIRSRLPQVDLMRLVGALTDQAATLPHGFDITLTDSSVLMQKTGSDYQLRLGTKIDGLGLLALQIQRVGSQWGFAAGVDISPGRRVTDIDGLAGVGDLLALFELDKLLLVVSSFAEPTFDFPDMTHFDDPQLKSEKITLPTQATGLVAGLNVYAEWTFDSSREQKLLKDLLGLDQASLGVTLQVGENPAQNAKLSARVTAKVAGLSLDATFGGLIRDGSPGLFLAGTLVAPINGTSYTFTVELLFVTNGAFLSGSMVGATSIDLGVFKIGNVALCLGTDWEAIPSLGVAGTIDVDTFESSLAVFFDSAEPSKSLVAGSMSDLSLADVLDTLTGHTTPSEIDDLLHGVNIHGTHSFELPAEVAPDLDGLHLDKVSQAFAAKGVTIPATSKDILLVRNTPGQIWYLTDLAHKMTHYELKRNGDTITIAREAQLYFAPQATDIGELHYPEGIQVDGAIRVYDFKAEASIDIALDEGIAVDATMGKIVIGTEKLFTIKAARGDGGPVISAATYTRPDNPVKQFREPHFTINGALEMLGLETEVFVNLTRNGFNFDLKGDLLSSIDFDVHVRIGGPTAFDAGGHLKIEIGTIDLGVLGKVTINTGVDAKLDISVRDAATGGEIKADLQASFVLGGKTHDLPSIHLDIHTQAFSSLPSTVWEAIKKFLGDLFKDALKWAAAVYHDVVEGVDDAVEVLKDVYGMATDEAERIWSGAKHYLSDCAMITAVAMA